MIFTLPVLLYQLLFVALLMAAHRFGRVALGIATALCLLWTSTHLFFLPLALLQTGVIAATATVLFLRPRRRKSAESVLAKAGSEGEGT